MSKYACALAIAVVAGLAPLGAQSQEAPRQMEQWEKSDKSLHEFVNDKYNIVAVSTYTYQTAHGGPLNQVLATKYTLQKGGDVASCMDTTTLRNRGKIESVIIDGATSLRNIGCYILVKPYEKPGK